MKTAIRFTLLAMALLFIACSTATTNTPAPSVPMPAEMPAAAPSPTAADAARFLEDAQQELSRLILVVNRASWVANNFITTDTQFLSANASEALISATVRLAKEAAKFDAVDLPASTRRDLLILKTALVSPAPSDPQKTAEVATLAAKLEAAYGEGKFCPTPDRCIEIQEVGRIFARSRDPKELLDTWAGWHSISPPMRPDYQRFATLMNEGARELGFPNTGALWRSNYDMPPDALAEEVDRLWEQVKPLYDALHCHVRAKLSEKYGQRLVPPNEPIPAHLLGNVWAQEWGNIYDLVAPPKTDPGFDLTERIAAKKINPIEMVRIGERFFTSLGFDPLPATFWERSLFTKPRDREVVCHASASDLDDRDDLRIKMCIEPTSEDFRVIHHELGHNFYQRAYKGRSLLHRDSAHDGFHEALGDTIAKSITPAYLKTIGMIEREPDASKDLGLLMREALDRVAFLPFGIVVDRWRWKVFDGSIRPEDYNKGWWELREKYQGVKAPLPRSEADFDPGAKFHVPGNTPYTRYFLAHLLEFQLHRALCRIAGSGGPLHRCTIYGNREVGQRLEKFLSAGRSRPWPDLLEELTGERKMDATAILEYFAPLKGWLDEQNRGRAGGW